MIKTILPATLLFVLLTGCSGEPNGAPDSAMPELVVERYEPKDAAKKGRLAVPKLPTVKNGYIPAVKDGKIRAVKDGDKKAKETVVIHSDNFEIAKEGETLKLPADFPDDVPVYPGARVIRSALNHGTKVLVMQSSDAPAKITAYYEKELKGQGWQISKTMKFEEGRLSVNADKGKRMCITDIASSGAGSSTTIIQKIIER